LTCSRASRLSRKTSTGKALVVRAAEGNKVMLAGGAPSSVPTSGQPPANQKGPLRRLGQNQGEAPCLGGSRILCRFGKGSKRPPPAMQQFWALVLKVIAHDGLGTGPPLPIAYTARR
jgi:hypothetical protein